MENLPTGVLLFIGTIPAFLIVALLFYVKKNSKKTPSLRADDSVLLTCNSLGLDERAFIKDSLDVRKREGKVNAIKHVRSQMTISLHAASIFLDALDKWEGFNMDDNRGTVIEAVNQNGYQLDKLVRDASIVFDESGNIAAVEFIRDEFCTVGLKEALFFVETLPRTADVDHVALQK